jgi:hypothetical protein
MTNAVERPVADSEDASAPLVPQLLEVHPSVRHWEEILRQWITLNVEVYTRTNHVLAPYSYRERPNVSALAVAAVRAGWIALEECWLRKKDTIGAECHGRADLMLWKDSFSSIVEAKLTCDTMDRLPNKIRLRSTSARKEAEKCFTEKASEHLAVTFVVPRLVRPEVDRSHAQELFNRLVEHCCEASRDWRRRILAGVFPGPVERRAQDKNDENMFGIGVFVLGEIIEPSEK